jgi:hypothetical protein
MQREPHPSPPPPEKIFDPFRDRVSRDIRNALAEAFVAAWGGDGRGFESLAAALRRRHALPVYRDYIDRRLALYLEAVAARGRADDPDLLDDMVVLWNQGLFFEVHELLEGHWHDARGARREALKTLIQAAGVFVHREAGRVAAAERMGRRVSERIDALRPHLGAIRNLDDLREALVHPAGSPPQLEGPLR